MVKACYAGTKWDQSDYENYILNSKKKLKLMDKKPVSINPGEYRTYIEPMGVSDLIASRIECITNTLFVFIFAGLNYGGI